MNAQASCSITLRYDALLSVRSYLVPHYGKRHGLSLSDMSHIMNDVKLFRFRSLTVQQLIQSPG